MGDCRNCGRDLQQPESIKCGYCKSCRYTLVGTSIDGDVDVDITPACDCGAGVAKTTCAFWCSTQPSAAAPTKKADDGGDW